MAEYLKQPGVRFLGTDQKVVVPEPLQSITPEVQLNSPTLQGSIEQTNALASQVGKANAANTQAVKQAGLALAESRISLGQAESAMSNQPSGVEGIAKVATQLYGVYQEFKKKELEAERNRLLPQFYKEAEELITQSDTVLRDQGYPAYKAMRDAIAAKYSGILSPDDLVKFYSMVEQPAQSFNTKLGEKLATKAEETRALVIGQKARNLSMQLSGQIVSLKNPDPKVRSELLTGILANIDTAVQDLEPDAQIQVIQEVTGFVNKYLIEGTEEQVTLNAKLSNLEQALTYKNQADIDFQQQSVTDPINAARIYEARIAEIGMRYGVDFSRNPYDAEQRVISAASMYRDFGKAEAEDIDLPANLQTAAAAVVGDIGVWVANDPTAEVTLKNSPRLKKENPLFVEQALALASSIKEAKVKLPQFRIEKTRLTQAIVSADRADAQSQLSWLNGVVKNTEISPILERLGVAAQLNADVTKLLASQL